ncbi:SHOCT domain-containing protein [Niabella sp. CC-SYL272]|uniref:SHOCT domain-containing protein n=1 Tax=Niabella agricola TaxID=2891571 RepID=UPI001F29B5B5|nr:SHOCT domain-containing protein [Niabella agricola]MCF3107270.1 SHOCT domain-containing protein [Niabella agricola]
MRNFVLLTLMLLPMILFAQKKNDSLVTSIGWVIHKGDIIKTGIGSMDNGRFAFIQVSQATQGLGGNPHLPANEANKEFKIFKIKVFRGKQIPVITYKNTTFSGRWDVNIEGAIAKGEIIVPEQYRQSSPAPAPSKADELAKLKKLLDDGVLTKEEFEKEKGKILER